MKLKGDKTPCFVLWDDCALMVVNPTKAVLKHLTLRVKSMEPPTNSKGEVVRGPMRVQYKNEQVYTVIREEPGMKVIQTYQGFVEDVCKILREDDSIEFSFLDDRQEFMKPDLKKMFGFRFSQGPLVQQVLLKDQSGLLGAPTRYGKTTCIINTVRAYPKARIVIVIPGQDLLKQMFDTIKEAIPGRQVVMLGGGSKTRYQSEEGITVCSADSMHKLVGNEIDLILADEPHALVTEGRMKGWENLCDIRKIGFGATLKGRFDGKDKLITGIFGPVLGERTYLEAVEEGAICPLVILFLKNKIHPGEIIKNRNTAYNKMLFLSRQMARITAEICHKIIPQDQQTLVFIDNEKQADLYLNVLEQDSGVIAMAKKLTKKEREALFAEMQTGDVKRCFATNIYAQGVTFSDMRAMINCAGGGNNASAIQKPGRLAEIRPDKNWGVVIDMLFTEDDQFDVPEQKSGQEWRALIRDSFARMEAYKEKGYKIIVCEDIEELKREFNKHQ